MVVRLFVGCAPDGLDAESLAVLEYSVRKNSSLPVEIEWMTLSRDPASFWSGWNTERWPTPFSGFRWAIPAFCGFDGRAVYCDSDVIWMGDIARLWQQPMPRGTVVLGRGGGSWRLCVSLWDCAAAKDVVLPLDQLKARADAHRVMGKKILPHVGAFAGHWNVLDGGDFADLRDPTIGCLHYTSISTQPQLRHALPRLEAAGQKHWFDGHVNPHWRPDMETLFDTMLSEAIEAGYRPENYIPAVRYGEVEKASLRGYRGGPRAS